MELMKINTKLLIDNLIQQTDNFCINYPISEKLKFYIHKNKKSLFALEMVENAKSYFYSKKQKKFVLTDVFKNAQKENLSLKFWEAIKIMKENV